MKSVYLLKYGTSPDGMVRAIKDLLQDYTVEKIVSRKKGNLVMLDIHTNKGVKAIDFKYTKPYPLDLLLNKLNSDYRLETY